MRVLRLSQVNIACWSIFPLRSSRHPPPTSEGVSKKKCNKFPGNIGERIPNEDRMEYVLLISEEPAKWKKNEDIFWGFGIKLGSYFQKSIGWRSSTRGSKRLKAVFAKSKEGRSFELLFSMQLSQMLQFTIKNR